MKGIVFTEFLELVESKFGIKTVQDIIDACDLASNGVYTAVGTYNHQEMFEMVGKLSELQGIPIPELLQIYGRFFFSVLSRSYPQFMKEQNLFTFLASIDGYIHPEVLKLYPDAELPRFKSERINSDEMTVIYESSRKMVDFAIGLMYGASDHYQHPLNIEVVSHKDDGQHVVLKLTTIDA